MIDIHVANGRAYVWEVDDIATLRTTYRIGGILTGTLPQAAQQNIFLGVPLVLSPEEVALLVVEGAAQLVRDPTAHKEATPEQIAQLRRFEEKLQREANELAAVEEENKKQKGKGKAAESPEAREKREKRAAAKLEKERLKAAAAGELFDQEEDNKAKEPKERDAPYLISTPTSSNGLAWFSKAESTSKPSSSSPSVEEVETCLISVGIPFSAARVASFRALHAQGFFMGTGIKFGADWLVYPGDPLRYHSHFTASVIDSPDAPLLPMEIVAHGRLGTATKKVHLMCVYDEKTGNVEFTSLEWAGFG
ncbi:tRNA-intron endonuclease catalytic domain-like protein [Cylindrobasidium torrendii FP15055 ss-10]|uniref:tRNA-splicing endonuclease subunit Sen34 n=1 Tax=Cylindrobasidium torrendii FP15055 ss-10 TaxID=1314674 RepID=A0A0D7B7W1_9AGAR|nr:tRNA-intron endonuclease catalytic domain-like protein [Cylindrobasidium torrendii FP15055 ss-10]